MMNRFKSEMKRPAFICNLLLLAVLLLLNLLAVAEAEARTREKIRIAAFNIQTFGPKKASNQDVMQILAEIVRKYDLIAVQEIMDKQGSAPKKLLEKIKKSDVSYKYLISERTGKNPDDLNSEEQYAYYYNAETVEVLDSGGLYDDKKDYFQREPFVSRFKAKNGNFTFVLIVIHTRPKSAVSEIGHLTHVVNWARQRYKEEDDFILLGDFNAGCNSAKVEELKNLDLSGPQYIWIVPHNADTNLADSTCAYDRIVVTKETKQDFTGTWGVDRSFKSRKVSDHWPVWAEFFVNEVATEESRQ